MERPLLDRNMSSSTDLSSLSKSAVAHIPLLIRERRLGESQRSLFSTTSLDRSNDMKGIIADSGSDRFNQIMAVRIIERRYLAQSREVSPQHLHDVDERPPDWGELCFVGQAARGGAVARYVRVRPSVPPSRVARMIAKHWKLRQPSAVLSIIGGSAADGSAGADGRGASSPAAAPAARLGQGPAAAAATSARREWWA